MITLLEDSAGVLWAGNASGLFTFDGARWHGVADPALAGSTILALHESRDGSLWVATRSSVFRRARGQRGFALMDTVEIGSNAWQGFSEDAHGVVWISDFREGFRRVGAKPRAQRDAARLGRAAAARSPRQFLGGHARPGAVARPRRPARRARRWIS